MEIIRRKLLYLLGGVVLLFLLAIGLFWAHLREKEGIAIGKKGSEGEILSEIIAQLIEHDLRIPVKRECQVEGTLILFEALKANQIDLYVEYTGTALTALLRRKIEGKSPSDIFDEVKKGLHAFDIIAFLP